MFTTDQKDEFERARGETTEQGSKGLRAVGPDLPPDVPVGIAPPAPLQVVSAFDTRPISAYDFVFSDVIELGNGEAGPFVMNASVPNGYTAVLRRILIEFTPNGAVNVTTATSNALSVRVLRDGAPIPNNVYVFTGVLDLREWPTHQVYGAGQSMGVSFQGGVAVPLADTYYARINLIGTLIQTKGMPPETEIASPAILTRTLEEWKNEVQR